MPKLSEKVNCVRQISVREEVFVLFIHTYLTEVCAPWKHGRSSGTELQVSW